MPVAVVDFNRIVGIFKNVPDIKVIIISVPVWCKRVVKEQLLRRNYCNGNIII